MTLDQDARLLSRTRPFDLLPRDAAQLVAFSCEKRKIAAGEALFEEGELADSAYFVLSGAIALSIRGEARARSHIVGKGALIGEMALLAEAPRRASARAEQDAVLLRIPRTIFRKVLGEFPREAAALHAKLAARTREMVNELEALRVRAIDLR